MTDLEQFIRQKYQKYTDSFTPKAIKHITDLWNEYKDHVADPHFFQELICGDPEKFQQRYWEMSLFNHLSLLGYSPVCSSDAPDFKVSINGITTWIEAVAPSSCDEIRTYLKTLDSGEGAFHPFNAFTLRYTQAFKDKKEKIEKYIKAEKINPNTDAVIIAINAGNLGKYCEQGLSGKSHYPLIVDITYGIGSPYVSIDPKSRNIVSEGIETELELKKKESALVPKAYFRNGSSNFISAAIASDAAPETAVTRKHAFYTIHNHCATVKLPHSKLGSTKEYFVSQNKILEASDHLDGEAA